MSEINSKLLNLNKTDYGSSTLILGQDPGLGDTIYKPHQDIWDLYKTLKTQDWDENEWDYGTCRSEFQRDVGGMASMMIKQLAWQWEADTAASRSILGVFGPFISSSELFAAWTQVTQNENVHWSTYAEIVRMSFDDPKVVMDEVTKNQAALDRLTITGKVLSDTYVTSHKYALGMVENNQETYDQAMLGIAALYILERLQFMASFAITFSICEQDMFIPIGKAVQKIAMDEFEIHTELDRLIFQKELPTERGQAFLAKNREFLGKMIDDALVGERDFLDYLHEEGESVPGVTKEMFFEWSKFNAREIYHVFGAQSSFELPTRNPLKFMESWLDLDSIQAAPMEEQNAQYRVNVMQRDDDEASFDSFDF